MEEMPIENPRHGRIKRVKRFLRYMPRRATLHRYPFLKYFADFARKRSYLWSFRAKEVVPALYAGFILTFMPLQGMQIPTAFLLALIFRGNLMILVGLQLISNPLTLVPIYYTDFYIGNKILNLLSTDTQKVIADAYQMETGRQIGRQGLKAVRAVLATMLGGMVIGYICGFISSIVYQLLAKRYNEMHGSKEGTKK